MGDSNPACESGNFSTEFSQLVCSTQGLGLYGGNRNLKPETSENFDFGIVVAPIHNIGITLDYYRILIKNALGTVPDTAIYGNPTSFANDYILNSFRNAHSGAGIQHTMQPELHGRDLRIHSADDRQYGRHHDRRLRPERQVPQADGHRSLQRGSGRDDDH